MECAFLALERKVNYLRQMNILGMASYVSAVN